MSRSSSDLTDKYTYRLTWSEADKPSALGTEKTAEKHGLGY